MYAYAHMPTETDRKTNRKTNREDRQIERQTDRQTYTVQPDLNLTFTRMSHLCPREICNGAHEFLTSTRLMACNLRDVLNAREVRSGEVYTHVRSLSIRDSSCASMILLPTRE